MVTSSGTAGKALQVETQGKVGCHSQVEPGAAENRAASGAAAESSTSNAQTHEGPTSKHAQSPAC